MNYILLFYLFVFTYRIVLGMRRNSTVSGWLGRGTMLPGRAISMCRKWCLHFWSIIMRWLGWLRRWQWRATASMPQFAQSAECWIFDQRVQQDDLHHHHSGSVIRGCNKCSKLLLLP